VDGIDYADWSIPKSEQVVSAPLAYLINAVLSDETGRWPSLGRPNPFELGRPVAAKPGASLDGLDTWAAGYTPQRVVVVWMGASQPLTFRPAAGLWSAVMQTASREASSEGWLTPPGVVHLRVCDPSGLLPTPACPNVVDEVFIDGYQPVQPDTLYRTYAVNRETGFLATVYTPPQLVEKRVYLLVPPEARDWAVSTGLGTPPTMYDTLRTPPLNLNVNITSPEMFADLKGKVIITGTAAGEDFAYYRLQAGQGLDPETWVLIAEAMILFPPGL
jgi:membrane carboxypeptidase/penicillin-binding protein PbpC